MSPKGSISIKKYKKGKLPSLPFLALKNAVLGRQYDLSLAFVSAAESKRLNRIYRSKDKPANILSFPLSKSEGEIVICLSEAKKDAKNFDQTYADFVPFLFIHGLFHLKGLAHGSTMESKEAAIRKKFGVDRVAKRK